MKKIKVRHPQNGLMKFNCKYEERGHCRNCKFLVFLKEIEGSLGTCVGSDAEGGFCRPDNPNETNQMNSLENRFVRPRGVGIDGAGVAYEIRPKHHQCPYRHAFENEKLVRQTNENLKVAGHNWVVFGHPLVGSAHSRREPCGGHVHISRADGREIEGENRWKHGLMRYFAIPFSFLVPKGLWSDRINQGSGYGRFNDAIRRANGSGYSRVHEGFEFRILPTWLWSRDLMFILFALLKVVSNALLSSPSRYGRSIDNRILRNWNNGHRTDNMTAHALAALSTIKEMPLYYVFQYEMDFLTRCILQGLVWNSTPYDTEKKRPLTIDTTQKNKIHEIIPKVTEMLNGTSEDLEVRHSTDEVTELIADALRTNVLTQTIARQNGFNRIVVYGLSDNRGEMYQYNASGLYVQGLRRGTIQTNRSSGERVIVSDTYLVASENEFVIGIPRRIRRMSPVSMIVAIINEFLMTRRNDNNRGEYGCRSCGTVVTGRFTVAHTCGNCGQTI